MEAKRALVIDDDRSWQEILTEILQDEGLEVDIASSLEELPGLVNAHSHCLAVVDLSLDPDDHRNQDGLKALAVIQHTDPTCAAILLSGFATVETAVKALKTYHAFTVQRKETFRRSEFRQMVKQALASSAKPAGEENLGMRADLSVPTGREVVGQPAALLVEDDPGWQDLLAELLGEAGFRVRPCSGFGEALGCLRREKFSLAVVDLVLSGSKNPFSLQGMSALTRDDLAGTRLLASVRAAGTPAIVVSGITSVAEIERTYNEFGIYGFLQKQTFDRRSFLQTVAEAQDSRSTPADLAALTEREREVLELVGKGLTNKEIAERLVISTNTVKRHLKSIFAKLDIHTRSAAAARASRSE